MGHQAFSRLQAAPADVYDAAGVHLVRYHCRINAIANKIGSCSRRINPVRRHK